MSRASGREAGPLSPERSSAEVTLEHIEALQQSLMSERRDRLGLLNRIGELESMVNMLSTQFKTASQERDVERARSTLFDEVADIRSPALVVRTIVALLDYPLVHLACLLKVGGQWSIISELGDEHIYVTSTQMDELMALVALGEVLLERITSLPAAIVDGLSLAYSKRYDSFAIKDNLVFTAVSRDCLWLVLAEESLRPLTKSLQGWASLLNTGTRLLIEAFKRQQDDVERGEGELVKSIFNSVFETLFTLQHTSKGDVQSTLLLIVSLLGGAFKSCTAEVFIVDANLVGVTSSYEHLSLATHSQASVLLTAVMQKRTALCIDPTNPHRDLRLDCGNVVSPIAAIVATPLWTSTDISGYALFRLFENEHLERYVKLAETLAGTIGYELHFQWSDDFWLDPCFISGRSLTLL